MRGGSEFRPVWVSCPLASPGSHKLARCNSPPDGLAPAGGNTQPKYAYPLGCHAGRADKDSVGRRALSEEDVWAVDGLGRTRSGHNDSLGEDNVAEVKASWLQEFRLNVTDDPRWTTWVPAPVFAGIRSHIDTEPHCSVADL
ncbi:unnamed protein product [Pleuronectes platessa]|uniref:Uncharacterized protein n=1 Tax=Pleuronectes platessa TaxID=8262 RepID=A0A9N7YF39_PLEPL|nr:unnamed protein product [Pleuronectes platessa]